VSRLLIKVQKRLWDRQQPAFVDPGDICADGLIDLNVKDNRLSVWEVAEDNANLERVLTALAANCTYTSKIDYILFDSGVPLKLGLAIKSTPGGTPDSKANETWHRDLIELSGKKLLAFALAAFENASRERCQEHKVVNMLKGAIERNEIEQSKLSEVLLAKLQVQQS